MNRPVLLVDDHSVIAHSVAESLGRAGHHVQVIDPARTDDPSIVTAVSGHADPVVLLDLNLGDRSSIPLISPLVEGGATVVILTATEDHAVLGSAVEAGAVGIVHKSDPFDELVQAVDSVVAGRAILGQERRNQLLAAFRISKAHDAQRLSVLQDLTVAERAVLAQLMAGRTVREIASARFVSSETVRSQVKAILRKLGARTQLQALAIARDAGFSVDDPD
jgi:two-component system, NarL family, nitrate/nitrite response regulator NarL